MSVKNRAIHRMIEIFAMIGVIVLLFSISADAAGATSASLNYSWNSGPIARLGGGVVAFYGTYSGQSQWTNSQGTNWFSYHESVVVVDDPIGDITSPLTTLKFKHGGSLAFTVHGWEWNPCCYVVPPGAHVFGGNTTNYNGGYDQYNSGVDEGIWAFQLCDGNGCYGGVSRDESWNLW